MKIINTADLTPEQLADPDIGEWIYNGLDCCITAEVLSVIAPQLNDRTRRVYERSLALMAPVLSMNMRGVLIDQALRTDLLREYAADLERMEELLNELIFGVFEERINWRSNDQLKHIFYDVMRLPPVRKKNAHGQLAPTVDRGALEKLQYHYYAAPFIRFILAMRDLKKRMEVLETAIDSDNRIRTSYNIAGTNTGRLSSSFSDFGSGRNLQNIEERLRRIFVADPGMKFANIDLEQADSRNVGAYVWRVFGDSRYLDACEGGDLHTTVSRMVMPELPWPDDAKAQRALAEAHAFFRKDSLRQGSKKIGHGSNYYGKPYGISQVTGFPKNIIEDFQRRYFTAFPGIPAFHTWVKTTLVTTGILENLFERPRHFTGRLSDESTLREAIAFCGQSSTADFINGAMLAVWRLHNCEILLQVHDSILVQYPESQEDIILPAILDAMRVKIPIRGRDFTIPSEAKVGWNWSNHNESNPDGLKKYSGTDARRRQRKPASSFLDRGFL